MKESKKDLLEKYLLIDNYIYYVDNRLHKEDTLDYFRASGEFDKIVRKYSVDDLKAKIRECVDISRDSDLVKLNPILNNILNRKDENTIRYKKSLKYQWDILVNKVNKVLSQLHPWNWYEISLVDKDKVRVCVKDSWRCFEMHYYRRNNRVGDCTVDIPNYLYNFYHETDIETENKTSEFAAKENQEVYMIMCAMHYLYNNDYIVEEYCQAMFNYDVEAKRIEHMFESINESINNDATLILESAARKAYIDGKLSV